MKNYTITVNGKVYEVTVEEGFTGQGQNGGASPAPAAPKSAAAPVKEPAAAPGSSEGCGRRFCKDHGTDARQDSGCEGQCRTGSKAGRCHYDS